MTPPDNGTKYVTYQSLMDFQSGLFNAIDKRDQRVISEIQLQMESVTKSLDTQINSIVNRLNIYSESQRKCRNEIEPIIRLHKSFSRILWLLISSAIAHMGTILGIVYWALHKK